MKMTRVLMTCMVFLVTVAAIGQKIKVESGKIKDLTGISELKIEYDYSGLGVGKFEVEADYIKKKVADMNEDETGTGDRWKESWFNDRPKHYEPKFEELFSKYAEFINSGQEVESDYVMNVHTTFIEPGFNVGVARKPASINLEVSVSKGGEELVHILILKSPGGGAMGYDFDTGFRIAEAYAKAAKSLGKYLTKNLN
ncbi:MAG: hypothetical protein GY790_18405 [Bacteroidetes bacterium]|nr:hypothetical protein [Bacteroidota bacterium]